MIPSLHLQFTLRLLTHFARPLSVGAKPLFGIGENPHGAVSNRISSATVTNCCARPKELGNRTLPFGDQEQSLSIGLSSGEYAGKSTIVTFPGPCEFPDS